MEEDREADGHTFYPALDNENVCDMCGGIKSAHIGLQGVEIGRLFLENSMEHISREHISRIIIPVQVAPHFNEGRYYYIRVIGKR